MKCEEVKIRIFKRDGLELSPYPGQEYNVDISTHASSYQTKLVSVKGVTVFQNWFQPHPVNAIGEVKGKQNRLRANFYYEEGGEEKLLQRPGLGGPPIIDFTAHPASVMLFEIAGYHISPDRVRQLVREKEIQFKATKGKTDWIWTFKFDNGPVLVPFAYRIDRANAGIRSYTMHLLNWKQDPSPPPQEDRTLPALANSYEMEFLYLDTEAQLPISLFFPYNNLKKICEDYDNKRIFSNRMIDLLDKLFEHSQQVPKATRFKWTPDLTEYYQKQQDENQMFRYSYPNHHEFRLMVPAEFSVPDGYKSKNHPKLKASPRIDPHGYLADRSFSEQQG